MRRTFVPGVLARRRWLIRALAATMVCLALWTVGLVQFARQIPRRVDDPTSRTDAIVVLTGGSERLGTGLRLLDEQRAGKLFVSGVHRGVEMAELLSVSRQGTPVSKCCIVLGHNADDTAGNARETAEWMAAEGFDSLRLVTSNYHMRRSLLEFRRALPEATIIAHPVIPSHVKQREWWRFPGTASLVVEEYSKYLVARARHLVGGRPGDRGPAQAN